jgi:hypothetical protein
MSTTRSATLTMLTLGLAASGVRASAAQIFSDPFDYADDTALKNVWAGSGTATFNLDSTKGNPGTSVFHGAGTTAKRSFTPTTPTDANKIVWQFDFYDDGTGNKRITGGLRNADSSSFLEMGRYNNLAQPEGGANASGYGIRWVGVGGDPAGNAGWMTFVGNPTVQTGWSTFTATIGASDVLFELDLGADGTVDATRTVTTSTGGSVAYSIARIGGPSDLSSAGGGANFDNYSVSVVAVPEPATLSLAGAAALALLGRRRAASRRLPV